MAKHLERLAQDLADAAEEDGYDGPIPGASAAPDLDWLTDYSEVAAFGRVLDEAAEFDTIEGVLDYFDGPHKWAPEHAWWVALDRPRPDSGFAWRKFTQKLAAR